MPRSSCTVIRHFAAPYDGPRFAVAGYESTVFIWDLKVRKKISSRPRPIRAT